MDAPQELSTTTTLTTLLSQTALGIAAAQTALDAYTEAQIATRDPNRLPPVIAFGFSEVEIDLSLAISITRVAGKQTLSVLPASPLGQGLFQTTSFSSRLRARIAPIAQVDARQAEEANELEETANNDNRSSINPGYPDSGRTYRGGAAGALSPGN